MYKCDECSKETKGRLFRKPKEWQKYKAPDGMKFFFCSKLCKDKWVHG